MSDKNECSIAVVGCGYWGPNYVRNLGRTQGARMEAICDLNPERLQHMASLYPDLPAHAKVADVFGSEDVDAVVVATPVSTHYAVAREALEAGKHVLIEKPMASSVRECEELVALAEARGLTLMVGHTFLYSEPIHHIKSIVDSGEIGDLLYVNAQRLNLGLFQKDINVAWDLAPHDLSIILYILGKYPVTVNCQGNAHISQTIEDVTNISLAFNGREFATIQSSWLEPRKVRQMTIVGTRKMIVYDDLEPREKIRIYDTRVERPPHYDSFAEFQYAYHYGDCYIPHLQQEEPLFVLCRHFVDCIRTGNRPRSCGRQGLELVRILEACEESLRADGAPISLAELAGSLQAPVTSSMGSH